MVTSQNEVAIDPVLQALGPLGLFAWVQTFIYISGYLCNSHQLSNYVFTAQYVDHQCAAPVNDSDVIISELHSDWLNTTAVHYGKCFISVSTNVSGDVTIKDYPCVYGMEYDAPKDKSITSEFDLVCDRKALAGLTQTILQLGIAIGSIILPSLADLYGRKRIVVIGMNLMILASLSAGLVPNYAAFVVFKFVIGFAYPCMSLVGTTAAQELFPSTRRGFVCGFCTNFFWALCILTVPLLAFLLRFHSWRALQLVPAVTCAFVIFFIFVKEPVRWLVANGKIKEAESVLTMAARWNGKDVDTILTVFRRVVLRQHHSVPVTSSSGNSTVPLTDGVEVKDELLTQETDPLSPQPEGKAVADIVKSGQVGFCDLVRHKILRVNILMVMLIWFVDSVTYSGLYLLSGTLAFSLHVNFTLNAAVEGASCLVIIMMIKRLGRRVMMGLFHSMAGVGLIVSSVCFSYQDNYDLQIVGTVMSLVGKLGIGGAFFAVFFYTPQIFPTNIRNRAYGIAMIAANVGGMVAPFASMMIDYAIWAPGALFGTLSLCAVLLVLVLPESKGRELPQTIRDLEAWYHVTSADKEFNPSTETCV